MSPTRRRMLLALAAAAASGLAACGSSDDKLLSASTASELRSALRQVERTVADGDCNNAQQEVTRLRQEVDSLSGVEADLKDSLSEGTTRLESLVAEQCQTATTGPTDPVEVVPQEQQTQGEGEEKRNKEKKKDRSTGDEDGQGQGEDGGSGDESGGSGTGTGGTTGSDGVLP